MIDSYQSNQHYSSTGFSMKARHWFFAIVSLHVFLWTLLPTLLRHALPMDAIEGYVWGHQLQWGYDKNPWVNAWLTRLAIDLGGSFGVYLFSQLFVALAFFSVWRLGLKFLSHWSALAAVLMLEAIQYYTLAAIDFNDNVILLGLWPFLALLYYNALLKGRILNWVSVGVVAGFAMMTKYYTVCLLVPMFALLVYDRELQKQFRKPGIYIALVVCLLISLPHAWWLFNNHFTTIEYALNRTQARVLIPYELALLGPVEFALKQFLTFLGGAALLSLLYFGSREKNTLEAFNKPSQFTRRFLFFVGVGPFIFTVLLGLLLQWHLQTLWGTPLLSLWGLAFLAWKQPVFSKRRLRRFIMASVLVMLLLWGGCLRGYFYPGNGFDATFPAEKLSDRAVALWDVQYSSKPFDYVVGDRYLAGYVSYFAPSHPTVFIDADVMLSPWVSAQSLGKAGALFVENDSKSGHQIFAAFQKQCPALVALPALNPPLQRFYARGSRDDLHLIFGILPPGSSCTLDHAPA